MTRTKFPRMFFYPTHKYLGKIEYFYRETRDGRRIILYYPARMPTWQTSVAVKQYLSKKIRRKVYSRIP